MPINLTQSYVLYVSDILRKLIYFQSQINQLTQENKSLKKELESSKNQTNQLTQENESLKKDLELSKNQTNQLVDKLNLFINYSKDINVTTTKYYLPSDNLILYDENSILLGESREIDLRDASTNKIIKTLQNINKSEIYFIDTDKSKKYLFSASNITLSIYNFTNLEYISTINPNVNKKIRSIADINTNSIAVSYNTSISIYDISTQMKIYEYSPEDQGEIVDILSYEENKILVLEKNRILIRI